MLPTTTECLNMQVVAAWYIPCWKLTKMSTALIQWRCHQENTTSGFTLSSLLGVFFSPFFLHLRKRMCRKMYMHHNKIINITDCIFISKAHTSHSLQSIHTPLPCTLHIFYSLTLQSLEAVLATSVVVKPESQAVQFWLPVTVLNVPTGQDRQGRVSSGE